MANAFIFSASMTSGLPQLRSVFPPHPVLWPPSAPSAGPTSPRLSPPSSPPRRPAASKAPSREGMPPKAMMKKIKVHRPPNSAPRGKRSPSYVPLPPVNREAMWRYMEGRQDDDINYQLLEERNKEERLSCTSEERPGCVFRTEDPPRRSSLREAGTPDPARSGRQALSEARSPGVPRPHLPMRQPLEEALRDQERPLPREEGLQPLPVRASQELSSSAPPHSTPKSSTSPSKGCTSPSAAGTESSLCSPGSPPGSRRRRRDVTFF
jgi:hypothetical protein